jgi:hypothetical protein
MAPVDRPNAEDVSSPLPQGCRREAAGHKVKTELNVIPLVDVMFMTR